MDTMTYGYIDSDKPIVYTATATQYERKCFPVSIGESPFRYGDDYICSECRHELYDADANYCSNCGCRIEWEEE